MRGLLQIPAGVWAAWLLLVGATLASVAASAFFAADGAWFLALWGVGAVAWGAAGVYQLAPWRSKWAGLRRGV